MIICRHEDPIVNPSLSVIAGAHHKRNPENSKQIRTVERIHKYPGHSGKDNDLALLELTTELDYTDEILPVCLPKSEGLPGQNCVTTGWGKTKGIKDRLSTA